MSRIAIIGGHGKVAQHLARRLTGNGHSVTSLFRNPDHAAEVEQTGAEAVVADVENLSTEQITELLRGHDAVVWSAGAGGGTPDRTFAVDRDAAIRSMDAAEAAGASRYVMVSYFGAGKDHGVPEDDGFYAYAEAKADADEHLRASGLDWTILGPSALTLDPGTGRIETGDGVEGGSVSREDVAHVAAEVLGRPNTIGRTIEFNNGPTPVAEALDSLA
ncbi:SDR family oxidoreductase [Arthrobacter sp. zg-Y877]|uniref:SDR family oxidoreductase n=1 Tax=Arthrobacter sp. zg-Y877 TaxID=3049074 RepID=UPI0025A39681|nr:SDR family oxidoreductase [Arthrobacter sp. zg-Y877]MDM7989174.1 SDR family oxidoreductase [Arthrobacter sp. zg-Y877]